MHLVLLSLLMGLPHALPGSASATEPLSLGHCCFVASPYHWNLIQFSVNHFSLGRSLDLVCSALTPLRVDSIFLSMNNLPGLTEQESCIQKQLLQETWLSPAQSNATTFIYLCIYLSLFLWLFAFKVLLSVAPFTFPFPPLPQVEVSPPVFLDWARLGQIEGDASQDLQVHQTIIPNDW